MRDLEQNFVPSLLQHLECGATELHVYKMTGAVHEKLNKLNMCSKQDFIPITLLVIVTLLLKVVRNLFQTFHLLYRTVQYCSHPMIVHVHVQYVRNLKTLC